MSDVVDSRVRRGALLLVAVLVAALVPGLVRGVHPAEAGWARDACGAKVRKPTGGHWQCTFVDDFTGSELDTEKWVPVTTAANGFTHGSECFVRSRDNVDVRWGALHLTVREEAQPFTCQSPRGDFSTVFTGGYVSTWGRFAQTYGRFEFRARFPQVTHPGVHSALWLWPVDANRYGPWPASGEIDVAEFFSAYPDRAIPYVHYNGDKLDPNATNTRCLLDGPEQWHTYVLEWTPRTVTVRYDDQVCIVDDWQPVDVTKPAPFDHPFHLNLTQALGIHGNRYDPAVTQVPATLQVDHVKVWS